MPDLAQDSPRGQLTGAEPTADDEDEPPAPLEEPGGARDVCPQSPVHEAARHEPRGGDVVCAPRADDGDDHDFCAITVEVETGACAGNAAAPDVAWIADRLREVHALLAHVDGAPRRVAVRLVGDDRMRSLHHLHCGLDTTTDVLTWPDGGEGVDIVACVDEARRRAVELGLPVDRELLLYAVHGLLHCAGHDDHEEMAFEAMHAEEDRLLALIGVGPTFRAANRETPR